VKLDPVKLNEFLSALRRLGVSTAYATGGGSLIKLSRGSKMYSFHALKLVHGDLIRKILRILEIGEGDFLDSL
jgi:hypothetical protein